MSIENISSRTPENIAKGKEDEVDSEFPPFDPEKAKRLVEEAKEKKNTISIDVEAAYKILNEGKEARKDSSEYDFRNTDRYQEQTFILSAANSLADSPDITYIDRITSEASERATKDDSTIFEALKSLSQEADTDKEGGFAATDLMNAFIETTAVYVTSKDEKSARGFAKGLMITMEMQLAGAPADRPNRAADELRVDLALIKPIIDGFIEEYNTEYGSSNDFKDHLKNALEIEEIDLRSAQRRNMQLNPDAERRIQAIKSALAKLDSLQSSYEDNLKNLKDTAYANHRIIK